MSKDGYMGTGVKLLDPCTLRAVIDVLKSGAQEQAAALVERLYSDVKADIERTLKYSQ